MAFNSYAHKCTLQTRQDILTDLCLLTIVCFNVAQLKFVKKWGAIRYEFSSASNEAGCSSLETPHTHTLTHHVHARSIV